MLATVFCTTGLTSALATTGVTGLVFSLYSLPNNWDILGIPAFVSCFLTITFFAGANIFSILGSSTLPSGFFSNTLLYPRINSKLGIILLLTFWSITLTSGLTITGCCTTGAGVTTGATGALGAAGFTSCTGGITGCFTTGAGVTTGATVALGAAGFTSCTGGINGCFTTGAGVTTGATGTLGAAGFTSCTGVTTGCCTTGAGATTGATGALGAAGFTSCTGGTTGCCTTGAGVTTGATRALGAAGFTSCTGGTTGCCTTGAGVTTGATTGTTGTLGTPGFTSSTVLFIPFLLNASLSKSLSTSDTLWKKFNSKLSSFFICSIETFGSSGCWTTGSSLVSLLGINTGVSTFISSLFSTVVLVDFGAGFTNPSPSISLDFSTYFNNSLTAVDSPIPTV